MKIEITKEKEEYATIAVNKEEFVQLHNGCVAGSWFFHDIAEKLRKSLPAKETEKE